MGNELRYVDEETVEIADAEEGFHVHDDSSANWVIRKIQEARAYSCRVAEWSEKEQVRAKREEDFFLFRYGQQLMDYARKKIDELGGRRKSIALPAGTLGFRKEHAKIIIDDEAAVLAWAKAHKPDLVTIIERLSKSGLNEHIDATGEIPEAGLHIEPEKEKFFVR